MHQDEPARRLAVLVVNYFSGDAVRSLLSSLHAEEGVRVEVVVVDNSCDEDEAGRLRTVCAESRLPIRLLIADSNLGYGAGNDLAFRVARESQPDVVLVANPDTTVAEGSLRGLVEFALAHPRDLVSVTTLQNGARTSGLVRMSPVTGFPHDVATVPATLTRFTFPGGHFFAVSAERFARLGGFTDAYFLYCEELDLTLRNAAAGGGIAPYAGMTATHQGGLSINAGPDRSVTSFYHGTYSRVLLYRRYRALRPYLPLLVVLRTGWGVSLVLIGQRRAGLAVLRALRNGLTARRG